MSGQPQFGKGSRRRTEDFKKVQQNWDSIEWREPGTYCFNCGKTFKLDENRLYYKDGVFRCIKCDFN